MLESQSLHGVFMALRFALPDTGPISAGVLLQGEAGTGKSLLGLELIRRGHALIADDAPRFTAENGAPPQGRCAAGFEGLLHVRGLGLLDIPRMYGPNATLATHTLDLIARLETTPTADPDTAHSLEMPRDMVDVCSHAIPSVRLQGANLALAATMIEALARKLMLELRGYNAAQQLSARLAELPGKDLR